MGLDDPFVYPGLMAAWEAAPTTVEFAPGVLDAALEDDPDFFEIPTDAIRSLFPACLMFNVRGWDLEAKTPAAGAHPERFCGCQGLMSAYANRTYNEGGKILVGRGGDTMGFHFGNANVEQKRAIVTTDGPLLITAGPGTDKTFTLVKRVAYLIVEKGASPSQIMVATFTEKAAKELVTRISTELAEYGVEFDVGEMYVGTFHSICLRIIKEHLEYSTVSKNYRIADTFDQQYLVFQRYGRFKQLEHFEHFPQGGGAWATASRICTTANTLAEEMIDPEPLLDNESLEIKALGEVAMAYRDVISDSSWLDFATIQTETYKLIAENSAVLEDIASTIRYVMIDEYQDTNIPISS